MGIEILEYAWINKGLLSFARASTMRLTKAFDKAFDEAIKLNPQDPTARYAKDHVLQELGHSVEADAAFAKAKELGYQG